MKRVLAMALAAIMVISLAACSATPAESIAASAAAETQAAAKAETKAAAEAAPAEEKTEESKAETAVGNADGVPTDAAIEQTIQNILKSSAVTEPKVKNQPTTLPAVAKSIYFSGTLAASATPNGEKRSFMPARLARNPPAMV